MTAPPSSARELFELARGGTSGDRRSLARLLSLVERGGQPARELSRLSYERAGAAYSVGMTGAPGAGKSTLTASFVGEALDRSGGPVAVLAVDPSSPLSGGAILGDRVRMQGHALNEKVFIRSMATRGHLGGLAAAVPDAVRLLHACGWPLVVVETVGVGQVEVEVAGSCDTVVVVVNPGWGDSVQANKAGLLEVADVLVVNKADRPGVRETKRDLVHMLQLTGAMDWTPPIVETVAVDSKGVGELWEAVCSHRAHLEQRGRLEQRRRARLAEETERLALDGYAQLLAAALGRDSHRQGGLPAKPAERVRVEGRKVIERLAAKELDPSTAADELTRLACRVMSDETQEGSWRAPDGPHEEV